MSDDELADTDGNADHGDDVDVTVTIDDRTVIDVTGQRDVAVVVRSDGGEQIYLPPEDFEEEPARQTPYESPYRGAGEEPNSPYDPADPSSSPYQGAGGTSQSPYDGTPRPQANGLQSTPTGVRIVHPEPVSDFRLLR
jgi:hypothetical protein